MLIKPQKILVIYLGIGCAAALNPQVTISTGTLLGREHTNENGKVFHSYMGVPYAKPPLGNLRFKPPQKPDPWQGVLNATALGKNCRAFDIFNGILTGYEDCLYLNVYIPQTASEKPLPVMFWIHGGGFNFGAGDTDLYGPQYFMDYDVILVTSNYRLGPFGFLNLDIEEASGNAGLKDNVAALRWVQENIAAFGGDPNSVTLFGQSSGACNGHYIILSDIAEGLFHRAIAQSGSALNSYAFQKNHLERSLELCAAMGHPTTDPHDALNFLLQAPMEDFHNVRITAMEGGLVVDNYVFTPSIEKCFPGQDCIIPEHPFARLKSGKFLQVPFLTGINSREGIFFLLDYSVYPGLFKELEEDFERLIPKDLEIPEESVAAGNLAKELRKFYFNDGPVCDANRKSFADLTGDTWFVRGVDDNVRLTVQSSSEPVYYYEFSFDEFGIFKNFVGGRDLSGVSHADEIGYLFTTVLEEFPKHSPDVVTTQKRLLTMWTNFAKTGNPTPEVNDLIPVKWEPVTKDKINYLSIGKTLSMGTNPAQSRLQFWQKWKSPHAP